MNQKRASKRITAFVLALIIALAALPATVLSAAAAMVHRSAVQVGIISDIHYFAPSETGGGCKAFIDFSNSQSRQHNESDEILDAALNAMEKHAKQNGLKYVLVPGDLTKDGELQGHKALAARLEKFEKDTGISVFVINGNHDINNPQVNTFVNGYKQKGTMTSPEEYRDIYKNLGYDKAYHTYTPPAGEKAGGLSYSVKLDGGYRLIAMDACKYSADSTAKGNDLNETGANMPKELMKWVLNEIADAKSNGEEIIGMLHHSLSPHFDVEKDVLQGFVIDNYLEVSETLADAGMHYSITGHIHMSDTAQAVSDNGETITDIASASLTGYPNTFREVRFDGQDGKITADVKTYDVDCEENIIVDGKTYEKPYKNTYSYGQTYGKDGIGQMGINMINGMLEDVLSNAKDKGGVMALVKESGIDLEKILTGLIGEGLKIGNCSIFSAKNLMSFIEDLAGQIDEKYINDVDRVKALVAKSIDEFLSIKVSDVPCTKFIDTLGFGNPAKGGTLEDFAMEMVAYYSAGDEDISDDVFMQSALKNIENGQTTEKIFNALIKIILDDIIQNEILSNLDVHLSPLFLNKLTRNTIGALLDWMLGIVLKGDVSYKHLADFVFGLGILPYDSIDDILNDYMDEYLTDSQMESISMTIKKLASSFVIDVNPGPQKDNFALFSYSGRINVVATAEDYRLPSIVANTFGTDSSTSRNISWYTKYSVKGTDIEILPYSENPQFTGRPTRGSGIRSKTMQVNREYPGVDVGTFGIFPIVMHMNRHTIELAGLKPGGKYSYRIGDAQKGWWSETGVIETANDSDSFAFLHMTDPQSQNAAQYTRGWANTVDTAFDLFPESKFILASGDLVDAGTNVNQWQWLLDTASDDLMKTVVMPATGNHEDKGEATTTNFTLPNLPNQNLETGVYYSYDYDNAHFMVLNTNDLDENEAISSKQVEWLKADAKASNAQWKILMLHKAPYSNGSHFDDKDVIQIRNLLSTLAPELGIDVILQGHDHVYLRTDVMNNNKVVATQEKELTYNGNTYEAKVEPEGTIYSIAGTSGVKYYAHKSVQETNKQFPQAEAIVETDSSVFTSYHIEDNVLYYDAYAIDGDSAKRIDSVAIMKEDTTPEIVQTVVDEDSKEEQDDFFAANQSEIEQMDVTGTQGENEIPQLGDDMIWILVAVPAIFAATAIAFVASKRRKTKEQ